MFIYIHTHTYINIYIHTHILATVASEELDQAFGYCKDRLFFYYPLKHLNLELCATITVTV